MNIKSLGLISFTMVIVACFSQETFAFNMPLRSEDQLLQITQDALPEYQESVKKMFNEDKRVPNFIDTTGSAIGLSGAIELNPPILAQNFVIIGDPNNNKVDISFELLRNGNEQVLGRAIYIWGFISNYPDFCQSINSASDCYMEPATGESAATDGFDIFNNTYVVGDQVISEPIDTPISITVTDVELPFAGANYYVPAVVYFGVNPDPDSLNPGYYISMVGDYVGDGSTELTFDYTTITRTNGEYRLSIIPTSDFGAQVLDTDTQTVLCEFGDYGCLFWAKTDANGNIKLTTLVKPGYNDYEPRREITFVFCVPLMVQDPDIRCQYEYDQPVVHHETRGMPMYVYAVASVHTEPVYRFWSDSLQAHFYTISSDEKAAVIAKWPNTWHYEGIAFYGAPKLENNTCPVGLYPLYRFWSDQYQNHFYTMSEEEKNHVIVTWPTAWKYEGVSMCASDGTLYYDMYDNVYRFWSDILGGHFYTIEAEEAYAIDEKWSDIWTWEGTTFYLNHRLRVEPE